MRNERGTATMVVLMLLAVMALYIASNSVVLGHLHKELKLIESQQQKKLQSRGVRESR